MAMHTGNSNVRISQLINCGPYLYAYESIGGANRVVISVVNRPLPPIANLASPPDNVIDVDDDDGA
jgi:hypothetical protein